MTEKPCALIIEDDIYLADIFSATLSSIGLDVRSFHDGESGLQAIQSNEAKIIVLDLNLPKMSGLQVLQTMRKNPQTAQTWVLIVTANPTQAAELKKMEDEDQHLLILAKPISVDQMEQLASRLIL